MYHDPDAMKILKMFGFGRRDDPPSSESEEISSESDIESDQDSDSVDNDLEASSDEVCTNYVFNSHLNLLVNTKFKSLLCCFFVFF